eukprot:tig00000863_g4970.t1
MTTLFANALHLRSLQAPALAAPSLDKKVSPIYIPSVVEPAKRALIPSAIELYTPKYYYNCAIGGALACGLTHTAIVPLDLVKCRMQVNPKEYASIGDGFKKVVAAEGAAGLAGGWLPTLIGYSLQGTCKFGFYELFKKLYADAVGEENAHAYRTYLYLAASASAEVIADAALCPMEAVKVRMQTKPGFPLALGPAMSLIMKEEGLNGFYKGLAPLWMRQIPYTMVKFASFEKTVEFIYNFLGGNRADYSKVQQLGITFAAGYWAGVFCAIVSHPADYVVSQLNKNPGSSVGGILSEAGLSGVWRGLGARIIMIGTLTGLQWFIYDYFKVMVGLPTTGAAPAKK